MIVLYLKALVVMALATLKATALGLVGASSALWSVGGTPPNARRWLVAGLVTVWSLRLGLHNAARTAGIIDDSHAVALAREWGTASPRKMLIFLQNLISMFFPLPLRNGAMR
jgi:steroid 5-alpha reductase family enzyme